MEASIRLYHGDDGLHGEDLLNADLDTGNGDDPSGLDAMHRLVAQVRRLARRNFPGEAFATYYFASAAFHLRLLRLSTLTPGQAERVVSAILANLYHLVHGRKSKAG